MKVGFETIGNATVIVYDEGKPVFVTDPWIRGSSYFGSWGTSHEIPEAQYKAVMDCPNLWFSHGHPDHLNPDSLELFKGKTLLLPDHAGGRISNDLGKMGYDTRILPDREWVKITDRVKVMCLPDYYQDAIILIDVNGRLLINTNDAIDRGWGRFVRKVIKDYKTSFLLSLIGYGDADMINYYREDGTFMPPTAALKLPVGVAVQRATESFGASYYIPFSTMHRYQRTDSLWAHEYTTPLDDYAIGFNSERSQLLPAFVQWNCESDEWKPLNPKPAENLIFKPEDFGDSWSEPLSAADVEVLTKYFGAIEHLSTFLDYINFRVGGRDNIIPLSRGRKHERGLMFEVPRHSLMVAAEYRIFDDLLIGNFMKTTLIGQWPKSGLYPDFTPYVARYSDNAMANTKEEVAQYFDIYKKRHPLEFRLNQLEMKAIEAFRSMVTGGSPAFEAAKNLYWAFKKIT